MADRQYSTPGYRWHRPPEAQVYSRCGFHKLLWLAVVWVMVIWAGAAQRVPTAVKAPRSLEYQVKAAFLLNFTKFVEWPPSDPESPTMPFTICIVGENPFGTTLDQIIQGEAVNERKLAVRRVSTESTESCQMVYFSKGEHTKERLNRIGPHVLTVGEGEAFTKDGGMIGFVLENRRVRFIVNLAATRNRRFTVSSKLLAVAKAVEK